MLEQSLLVDGRAIEATPAAARQAANFFLLHFGGFHFVYLLCLVALTTTPDVAGNILVTNETTGVQSEVYIGQVHALDFLARTAGDDPPTLSRQRRDDGWATSTLSVPQRPSACGRCG